MIVSQLALLYICLRYAPSGPSSDPEAAAAEEEPLSRGSASARRTASDWLSKPLLPFSDYGSFLEFFAALVVVLAISDLIFGGFDFFVSMLGILALGIESTVRQHAIYTLLLCFPMWLTPDSTAARTSVHDQLAADIHRRLPKWVVIFVIYSTESPFDAVCLILVTVLAGWIFGDAFKL